MQSTASRDASTSTGRATAGQGDPPLDALAQYLRAVRNAPPLTAAEEAGLLDALARGNRERADGLTRLPAQVRAHERARARLVEGYQPFAIGLARRLAWRCEHLTLLDLVQEGNIGLLHALNAYDGAHPDASFRSWAGDWIRGALRAAYWRSERAMRLPARTGRALLRLATTGAALVQRLGREPTCEELAAALDLPTEDIRELLALQAQWVVSLHVLLRGEEGETAPLDEGRWLAAPPSVLAPGANAPEFARLHEALDHLPADERRVVALRYGFVDGRAYSQREVAELLELPRSLVPVLDRRARFRLRSLLAGTPAGDPAPAVA